MIRQGQRIALLGALSGTIPFAQLLDAGYRPWALETVATTLAFISAGIIGGLLSARKTPINAALFTLAFYFFADANLVSGATQLILLAIACTAVFLAFQKREEWLPTAVTAFAVMFSVFAAVQAIMAAGPAWEPANWRTPSTTTGSKPSVLHIVLDEMTTPALASNTPAPGHPAGMILDDLAARGFEVHDRADSNSFNTYKSVGAVVGMTNSDDNFIKLRGGPFSFEARQNGLLTKFKDAGYQVRAVQFGYLDICKGDPEFTCQTYPRGFEMSVFADMKLGVTTRLKLAILALHKNFTSKKYRGKIEIYFALARLFEPLQDYQFFSTPAVVLKIMDRLEEDAGLAQDGVFSFAHLLLPHFPYVLTAECELKPVKNWTFPTARERRHGKDEIYAGYWDQFACVKARLLSIIDRFPETGNRWIVIHGDHGARISRKTDFESSEDLHRTFLAIRGPGVTPGRNPTPVRLHDELVRFYTQFLAGVR